MVWDKTMHDFPDAAQLVQTRKQLGELLTTWQAVEPERLQQALEQQQAGRQQPLGRILLTQGWLDDETLAEAIAFQGDLPRAVIDVDYLRACQFPISADACVMAHAAAAAAPGRHPAAVASRCRRRVGPAEAGNAQQPH